LSFRCPTETKETAKTLGTDGLLAIVSTNFSSHFDIDSSDGQAACFTSLYYIKSAIFQAGGRHILCHWA
jgi:hypothetical protein